MANKRFARGGRSVVRDVPIDAVSGIADEDRVTYLGDPVTFEGIPVTFNVV